AAGPGYRLAVLQVRIDLRTHDHVPDHDVSADAARDPDDNHGPRLPPSDLPLSQESGLRLTHLTHQGENALIRTCPRPGPIKTIIVVAGVRILHVGTSGLDILVEVAELFGQCDHDAHVSGAGGSGQVFLLEPRLPGNGSDHRRLRRPDRLSRSHLRSVARRRAVRWLGARLPLSEPEFDEGLDLLR